MESISDFGLILGLIMARDFFGLGEGAVRLAARCSWRMVLGVALRVVTMAGDSKTKAQRAVCYVNHVVRLRNDQ